MWCHLLLKAVFLCVRLCIALECPPPRSSLLGIPFLGLVLVSGSCRASFLMPAGWSPSTRVRQHWPAWSGPRGEGSLHGDGCAVSVIGGTRVSLVFSVSPRTTLRSQFLLGEGGECSEPSCHCSGKGVSHRQWVSLSCAFLSVAPYPSTQWCHQA